MNAQHFLPGLMAIVLSGLASTAQAQEPPPIFDAVQSALRENHYRVSNVLGFHDRRNAFSELPPQGALLIGFEVGVGRFFDHETVYALRPIYQTADGETAYQDRGLFADQVQPNNRVVKTKVLRTLTLRAAPDYAVGGVTIRSGLNINGLSVTYMKIKGAALDPRQHYSSAWVGDRTGGSEVHLDGKGAPVVGVHGSTDEAQIKSLGVYWGRPPAPPALPKVEKKLPEPAVAVKQADPIDEVVESPTPRPPVNKPAAFNWAPWLVFGAVAVAVFAVLLVNSQRSKPEEQDDRSPAAQEERPAKIAKPSASPWSSASLPAPTSHPEAEKIRKEVALTLFAIAGMQFVCGLLIVNLAPEQVVGGPAPPEVVAGMAFTIILIAAAFAGLGVWSWSQPFLAALIGLMLYVGIALLDFASNPELVTRGIFMKLAIAAALVRAVQSASKLSGFADNQYGASLQSNDPEDQLEAPVRELLRDIEKQKGRQQENDRS